MVARKLSVQYIKILKNLRESIMKNKRGKLSSSVLLQHDNARPHTSEKAVADIASLGFQIMTHPPYSPDIAPGDFWLFAPLKTHIAKKVTVPSRS